MNGDPAFVEMFVHEARLTASLSHPNIVRTFEVGFVEGSSFFTMEHVRGEDLRSIAQRMRSEGVDEFPLEHALSIVLGVSAGLTYAHEKLDGDGQPLDIVHRDISPQNVMVTFAGEVKIVDFGIAQSTRERRETTGTGKRQGRLSYMSPEQARGERVDSRSDIFAVGVLLFELTTGQRLFKATTDAETIEQLRERQCPLPTQVRAGYPVELEDIVLRALARDPVERWQSLREMHGALEQFVRGASLPASQGGLAKFMGGLFEDRLAEVKGEELSQRAPESGVVPLNGFDRTARRAVPLHSRRGARAGFGLAALAVAMLVAASVSTVQWTSEPHPAPAASAGSKVAE